MMMVELFLIRTMTTTMTLEAKAIMAMMETLLMEKKNILENTFL
jgi:hypothetical protein